ncbi:Glutathione peroxidase 2 [Naganishia albida]|nr:Glutathione peroxidase 2 [Naganishia albida]
MLATIARVTKSTSIRTISSSAKMSLFDLSVEQPSRSIPLKDVKDKTILFVNVASACGLTPQYKGLQALYDKYHSQGLEIFGFPCNQFKEQEPEADDKILQFCEVNYGVKFPLAKKADVNGPTTQPIYKVLKEKAGVKDIDWNFSKFLVHGDDVKWFGARTEPSALEPEIEKFLKASA